MIKAIVLGQLRHLLSGGAGVSFAFWLTSHGASQEDAAAICGGLLALASFGFSAYDKYRTHVKFDASKLNQ